MIGLALFAVLVWAAVALAASAGLGLGLRRAGRRVERAAPRERERWLGLALAAPGLLGLIVVGAVLLPHGSLGLPDHCTHHPDHHLHLCLAHGAPFPPTLLVGAALGALALWGGRAFAWAGDLVRAARARGRLAAVARREGELEVLPGEGLEAFVAGALRSRVFVTRPVAEGSARWAPVLAHEAVHARRRDPLRRALACLGATFHLPGVGRALLQAFVEAQERAADEEAAEALGERAAVAEALLEWARAARPSREPQPVSFGEAPLVRRVQALLAPPPPTPRPVWRIGLVLLLFFAPFVSAPTLHHAVETLLGLAR